MALSTSVTGAPPYPLTTIFTPPPGCALDNTAFTWPATLDPALRSVVSTTTESVNTTFAHSASNWLSPSCYPSMRTAPFERTTGIALYSPGLYCPMGYTAPGPLATMIFNNPDGNGGAAETHVFCCPTGYSFNETYIRHEVEVKSDPAAIVAARRECTGTVSVTPGAYIEYRTSTTRYNRYSTFQISATGVSASKSTETKTLISTIIPKVTFLPQGRTVKWPAVELAYRAVDVPNNPPKEMAAQLAAPVKSYEPHELKRAWEDLNMKSWIMVLIVWGGAVLLGMVVIFAVYYAGLYGFRRRTKRENRPRLLPSTSTASTDVLTASAAKSSVTVAATSTDDTSKKQHRSSWVVPWFFIVLTGWILLALAVLVLLFATSPELEDAIIASTGSADSVLRVLQAVGMAMRTTASLLSWTVVADLAWIGMSSGRSMTEMASLLDVVTGKGYSSAFAALTAHLQKMSARMGLAILLGLLTCLASDFVSFGVVASTGIGSVQKLTRWDSVPFAPGVSFAGGRSSDFGTVDRRITGSEEPDETHPIFISAHDYPRMLRHKDGNTFAFLPVNTSASVDFPSAYSGMALVGNFSVSCRRIGFTGKVGRHDATSLSGKFATLDPVLADQVQNLTTDGFNDFNDRVMMFAMDRRDVSGSGSAYPEIPFHRVRPQEILIWSHGRSQVLSAPVPEMTQSIVTVNGSTSGFLPTGGNSMETVQQFSFFGCEALFPTNVGAIVTGPSGIPSKTDEALEGCKGSTPSESVQCPNWDIRTAEFSYDLFPNDESTNRLLNTDQLDLASLVTETKKSFATDKFLDATKQTSISGVIEKGYRPGVVFRRVSSEFEINPLQRAASLLNPIMLNAAEKNDTTAIADALRVVLLHSYSAVYQRTTPKFRASGPVHFTTSTPVSRILRPWILYLAAGYALFLVVMVLLVRIAMLRVAGVDRSGSLLAVSAVVKGSPLDPVLENGGMKDKLEMEAKLEQFEKRSKSERGEHKIKLGVREDGSYGVGWKETTSGLRKRGHAYELVERGPGE